MPQIIKDRAIVEDNWIKVDNADDIGSQNVFIPAKLWSNNPDLQNKDNISLWIEADTQLDDLELEKITQLAVIAIDFPIFTDGRGFSKARLLRERYHFQGEIRAVGNIVRDQLCYLKRCGFNAFQLEETNLEAALRSLDDFTEGYQTSVDQPIPLFRRRQA